MVYFLSFSPVIYRHKYTHLPWVFQTRYISKLRKVKTRQHDKAQRVTCEAQEDEKASKSPILHEVSYKRNQERTFPSGCRPRDLQPLPVEKSWQGEFTETMTGTFPISRANQEFC